MFGIKQKDRSGHIYIIGKTGTGKSTLIKNMLLSDVMQGNGFAIIDPHGDFAEEVLNLIPESRIQDVIYFNPADTEYPIAFNPLDKVDPESYHLVVSGLISVFKKIWPEFWGPRLEHILRHSILTLLEYPNSSLLDLPRLLTDKEFRAEVLKNVRNQHVRDFWFKVTSKNSFFRDVSVFLIEMAIYPSFVPVVRVSISLSPAIFHAGFCPPGVVMPPRRKASQICRG